jgi:tetratricopeptide (TPR) repeat protein
MVHLRKYLLLSALLAAALGLGGLVSRAAPTENPPQLTDDTSDALQKDYKQAFEGKEWDKALGVLTGVLAKVPADSYDAAVVYQLEVQISSQKSDYPAALAALEKCLSIDDRKHYFSPKNVQDMLYQRSQLYYQVGATSKDLKFQADYFLKAQTDMERWLEHADPKVFSPDTYLYIATVYFSRGQAEPTGADKKTHQTAENKALMEKALQWTDKGLRSMIHPRDNFYQLKLAELFQLERFPEAAEVLELSLKAKPDRKDYWQQLAATYLQLASQAEDKKDTKGNYDYNVRVILTIERAQHHGYMSSPKENHDLVGLYLMINQFEKACELLEQGLDSGGIESTRANWEWLAYSYQQIHRDAKSVSTLERAIKIFPKSGPLEYQVAQVYYGMDKEKDSFEHMKRCIAKGGTEKPSVGWMFYAYLANELRDYDTAIKAATEAKKYPDTAKPAQQIIDAVNATIQNRESQR